MKNRSRLLVVLLLVSSIVVGLVGMFLKYEVLEPLGIHREESIIAIPFVLMSDASLSYQVSNSLDQMMNPTEPTEPPTEPTTVPTEPPEATTLPPETTVPETQAPTEPPTEPVPTYIPVDQSWFDDVLFIGDSRTVGLRDYARLGNADYFCAGSMSVFTVMEWESSDVDFKDKLLSEVLEENTYGKVYIHLGLNEVGGNKDDIMNKYQELIALVQETQPDAVIILQAIMSVTRDKAYSGYFSLENIQTINGRIQELALGDQFRFEDVNQWIADEEGYMREEMTFDGCHLYGSGYQEWSLWILENAGWHGIP